MVSQVVSSIQDKKESKEHGKPHSTFENVELRVFLEKMIRKHNSPRIWAFSQQVVYNRLPEMGKIQKTGYHCIERLANGKVQKHR